MQMCRKHSIRKDALPGKKFLGNLAPDLIEKRRESLERYLQRLISGDEVRTACVVLVSLAPSSRAL